MAPNKLEDRIREQLQEREIQPSKEAWSKMEARLGTASAPRSNKKVWYAIAAAFAGLAVLATFFFGGCSPWLLLFESAFGGFVFELSCCPARL